MNTLFRRTLTGAWIVIFVMGGFWLHPVSFFLTGLIMLIGTQYEYYLMIRNTGVRPQLVPGILTGIYCLCYFNLDCIRFDSEEFIPRSYPNDADNNGCRVVQKTG